MCPKYCALCVQVAIGEGSHPENVRVYGPGVEKSGLKAGEPTYFTVDCSDAGQGEPGVAPQRHGASALCLLSFSPYLENIQALHYILFS